MSDRMDSKSVANILEQDQAKYLKRFFQKSSESDSFVDSN